MHWTDELRFDDRGLIPVVALEASSGELLMLAWASREALERTESTGMAHYWSRSRNELWKKGATSGHVQSVVEIRVDCDADAVAYLVRQDGPACHTGADSCFLRRLDGGELRPAGRSGHVLTRLESRVAGRNQERPRGSYTTYLFEKGLDKILKKVGEESTEVVVAAKNVEARGTAELRSESADLLYHLLVLLRQSGLPLNAVLDELDDRFGGSGTRGTDDNP
jgi:phosphoribosyl-AMP cyclohydrolase / phosphoribosyl-ATP pyrophosphohydrolase